MSDHDPNADRIIELAGAVCDETASPGDRDELDSLVVADGASRRDYWDYCWVHVTLGMEARVYRAIRKARERDGLSASNLNPWESDALLDVAPVDTPSTVVPPIALPSGSLHGAFGYLSASWPMAYLVATVVFAVGLMIGALVHVSGPVKTVRQERPQTEKQVLPEPATAQVGRITGMADCVWEGIGFRGQGSDAANQKSDIINETSLLHLGDRLALKSGLLEITYDTGAKVILQGPVTYEVESPSGGYLAIGKLTAKLEKKSEVRGQRSEVSDQKSESSNQKSEIIHQKSFAVRTPTAVVTDLGTEFGVEVDASGATRSQVFRGSVTVRMLSGRGETGERERVLHENEATRIERGDQRAIVVVRATETARFVREMPKQAVKMFDLVDVVAGGDGFSGKRGRGIDPTNGRVCSDQPDNAEIINAQGDYQYHRVEGMPLVDGIFIPDGRKGPVQVDSAGHVFPDCPTTDNWSHAYVWAGGKLSPIVARRITTVLAGVDYAASDHSLLLVHSNKGITFNLEEIRKANPGYQVVRLRAVAGNVEPESEKGVNVFADVWVLVDGQVRFKRREINNYMGAMPVNVSISDNDRFLTLAVTDGGNSYMCDQIIFGDLRLELVAAKPSAGKPKRLP
jgi:hypothetical protein